MSTMGMPKGGRVSFLKGQTPLRLLNPKYMNVKATLTELLTHTYATKIIIGEKVTNLGWW